MKFKDLKRTLAGEPVKTIYLIFGNDDYLLQSARKQIISACNLQNEEFNLSVFDENTLPESVVAAAMSYPLLSEKKVVIFNIDKNTNLKQIEIYAANPLPESVLLLICRENVKVSKYIEVVDCMSENADVVEMWAKGVAKANGVHLSFEALQLLCAFCNCNMTRIVNEINKLKYLNREVSVADIQLNVGKDVDYQIYEIANCLQSKNGNEIEILQDLLKKHGVSVVPALISSLFSTYKRIYAVKTSKLSYEEIASIISQKPYAIKMARRNGQNITLQKVIDNINAISDCDFAFKNGKISAETAIFTVIQKCK